MNCFKITCTRQQLFEQYEKKFGLGSPSASGSKKLTKSKGPDSGPSSKEFRKMKLENEYLKQKCEILEKVSCARSVSTRERRDYLPGNAKIRRMSTARQRRRENRDAMEQQSQSSFSYDVPPYYMFSQSISQEDSQQPQPSQEVGSWGTFGPQAMQNPQNTNFHSFYQPSQQLLYRPPLGMTMAHEYMPHYYSMQPPLYSYSPFQQQPISPQQIQPPAFSPSQIPMPQQNQQGQVQPQQQARQQPQLPNYLQSSPYHMQDMIQQIQIPQLPPSETYQQNRLQ